MASSAVSGTTAAAVDSPASGTVARSRWPASDRQNATRSPCGETAGCTARAAASRRRPLPVAVSTAQISLSGTVCGPSTALVE